jgi:hypothetical protein
MQIDLELDLELKRGDNVTLMQGEATVTIEYDYDGGSLDWEPIQFVFEEGRAPFPVRKVFIERGDPLFGVFKDCLDRERIEQKIWEENEAYQAECRAEGRQADNDYEWSR